MTETASLVAERLAEVRARIDAAGGGRPVDVVAVTKGFGPPAVAAAVAAGLTSLGENYAQELRAKAADAPAGVQWHFIGAIQRNKIAPLAPLVALWQTVDRPAVADAIARHAPGARVLIQVNLAGESGRAGCSWDALDDVASAAAGVGLDVRGLMGVGPAGPAENSRPLFAKLAARAHALGLVELSMGMSADMEVAVQEGSTMVRIGTALFGPRPEGRDLPR
jgi:hypothetical protein